ncbi:hypothetical protein [Sphingomonas crocodyli]|uniref:hypothetical protein n=1 Tax=Sphingomonas crocodyli TaxID=1979270 RepID=UPI0013E2B34C|nr:hypothetical protein [Sphingomonas crocodyli]
MSSIAPLILSLLMLATVLLGAGGVWTIAKQRDMKRGVLMLIAAAVMFANVLISSL